MKAGQDAWVAETADLLDCSLRLVRTVRADPMTMVCLLYMNEADHFTEELRLVRSELRLETARHCETAARRLDQMCLQFDPPTAHAGRSGSDTDHLFERTPS